MLRTLHTVTNNWVTNNPPWIVFFQKYLNCVIVEVNALKESVVEDVWYVKKNWDPTRWGRGRDERLAPLLKISHWTSHWRGVNNYLIWSEFKVNGDQMEQWSICQAGTAFYFIRLDYSIFWIFLKWKGQLGKFQGSRYRDNWSG